MLYSWNLSINGNKIEVKASITDARNLIDNIGGEKYNSIYAACHLWDKNMRTIFIHKLIGFDEHPSVNFSAHIMSSTSAIHNARNDKKPLLAALSRKSQARTLEYLRRVSAGLPATIPGRH